jgi:hypothetical protein
VRRAGRLLLLAVLASGCGQGARAQATTRDAPLRAKTRSHQAPARGDPILARLALAPIATGVTPGYLMIADHDNNRVIMVSPTKRTVWQFPPSGSGITRTLSEPDHALVSADGRDVSTNQESAEPIMLASGNVLVAAYNTPGRIDTIIL